MKFTKKIRDPIHKWIKLSQEEYDIVNSPLLQRLHHIKQLSSVDLVFPGGNHTRLSHSIGAMYLSGKYAKHLFPDNPYKIKLARLAGLLHDIGHGVASHMYDNIVYKEIYKDGDNAWIKSAGHDQHRLVLIKSKYLAPLIEKAGVKVDDIEKTWTTPGNIINLIIQGPVGADKMDYMIRDPYYTGTRHLSTIGYKRIISNSLIINNKLHYKEKVIGDIIHVLQSRFHTYKEVYYNRNVVAGSILLELCLKYASKPLNLKEKTVNIDDFIFLNDGLLSIIANSKDPNLSQAKGYARRYLLRDLPKMEYEIITETSDNYNNNNNPKIPDKFNTDNKLITKHHIKGMSADQFDPYICIYDKNDQSITFKEYLDSNKHHCLTPKYTITRIFSL